MKQWIPLKQASLILGYPNNSIKAMLNSSDNNWVKRYFEKPYFDQGLNQWFISKSNLTKAIEHRKTLNSSRS